VFLRLIRASLAARRARLALSLTAVTLGVAVATALATLALEVGDDLARALRAAGPNFVVLPAGGRWRLDLGGAPVEPARAGATLSIDQVAALKNSFWCNNVLAASPEMATRATLNGVSAPLVGTWFDREIATVKGPWRTGIVPLRPHWTIEGRWPQEDAAELALGRELAMRIGVKPGAHVTVRSDARGESWLVTGIASAGGLDDRAAWAPLARVQALASAPGRIDRVWLSALVLPAPHRPAPDPARDPAGYERYTCAAYPGNVAQELSGRLGAEVVPATETVAGEAQVVERLDLLMLLLALAALAASTLGLVSTTTATVVERSVELALLRSLGAGARGIATLLLGETALVALAGGVLGWLVGSVASLAIRGGSLGGAPTLQPLLLPVALVLALVVATLGTLGPLRVALRLDPATVLRG